MGKIEVIWESNVRKLTIRDTGTGMTQDTIEKFLLNVGSSFYQSEAVLQKHTEFSAISRFGIGVLSTFMISDEVQILTVHPDDDFARRMTLPSVVKSYLMKKIDKDDPVVRSIGTHGTEVVLQVRRSADLKEVEAIVRYWLVLPQCELTCKTDDDAQVTIGFSDVKAVIDHYYKQEKEERIWKLTTEVREESLQGIELAYLVKKSNFTDVWDFAKKSNSIESASADDSDKFLAESPGMCVEGVRVRSLPAGYDQLENAPWVFVNLTGPEAPKTNVARSDIEQTPELQQTLLRVYSLIGSHVQNEFNRLIEKKYGIVEAALETDYIRKYGLEQSPRTDHDRYEEAMVDLKVIALEDENTCRAVSKKELDSLGSVWTVDSRLIRNIEGISGTLGINLPTEKIVRVLGKSIEPAIPLPRVLGNSKYPLKKMDIAKIQIYEEERTHRVDICWEIKKPGRWIPFSSTLLHYITQRSRFGFREDRSYSFTRDRSISSECSNYDMLVWRGSYFMLPTSGIPDLIDALGNNEISARWIHLLIQDGEIKADQKLILKEQLVEAKGKEDGEDLLNQLGLPFERRYGDSQLRGRDYITFQEQIW